MNLTRLLASLAAAGLAALPLAAQTTAPATPPPPAVTLSPFEVTAGQDTGYAGQDTLSGSRLRTNLRDIAAAISPMTAEFLRDIAATSIEGAMEYGVGTRMETDDARAAGPVGDGYNDSTRSVRIRGLPGGGRSLNFFSAPGEIDLYLTESLEVSRGPNSILFGFGSPAGRISVASKQARTDRAAYSITQNANTPGVDFAPSSVNWNTPAVIAATGDFTANTDSINEAIADAEQLFFDNPHVFEGKRFVGDPLHNLNLRTRFDFRTGRLKGLSIGGGTRLRLGRVAGARTDYTITPGSDFTDKWNGRTIDKVTTVDAKDQHVYDVQVGYNVPLADRRFRWSVQLNINNLLDQRELIVNNVHPRTLAPITYRYQDPRQFILTNTVSF